MRLLLSKDSVFAVSDTLELAAGETDTLMLLGDINARLEVDVLVDDGSLGESDEPIFRNIHTMHGLNKPSTFYPISGPIFYRVRRSADEYPSGCTLVGTNDVPAKDTPPIA